MKRLATWLLTALPLLPTAPALAARGGCAPFRTTEETFYSIQSAAAGDARYRAQAEHMAVVTFGRGGRRSGLGALLQRYVDRQTGVGQSLAGFDQKLSMMTTEGY